MSNEEYSKRLRVHRIVRVTAKDSTVEAVEEVRIKAGVPKTARFAVLPSNFFSTSSSSNTINVYVGAEDSPRPMALEFYWTEDV